MVWHWGQFGDNVSPNKSAFEIADGQNKALADDNERINVAVALVSVPEEQNAGWIEGFEAESVSVEGVFQYKLI